MRHRIAHHLLTAVGVLAAIAIGVMLALIFFELEIINRWLGGTP